MYVSLKCSGRRWLRPLVVRLDVSASLFRSILLEWSNGGLVGDRRAIVSCLTLPVPADARTKIRMDWSCAASSYATDKFPAATMTDRDLPALTPYHLFQGSFGTIIIYFYAIY